MFHASSVEALTSLTASAIEGNRPLFVSTSEAENKVGFTLDGQFYSEYDDNIKGSEIKEFDGKYTLSDFIISDKLAAKLSETSNYRDVDGDKFDLFDIKLESYSWSDASGKTIPSADYSKIIGCGSGYSMPLTLQINQQAKPSSQYGVPREGVYSTFTKTYQIASKSQLCYLRPYSLEKYPQHQWRGVGTMGEILDWNSPISIHRNSTTGGGYTSDYVPNYGFKAIPTESGGKTFPTTGFSGAKFQFQMTGAQTDYNYVVAVNPGGGVSVDKYGYVTLNSKPTGAVTIKITSKWEKSYSADYTFDPRIVWALPQGELNLDYNGAVARCGGQQNLFSRSELTNSPIANAPLNWKVHFNVYTRAIGQGLLAEWGMINGTYSYPNSNWGTGISESETNFSHSHYWTHDEHQIDQKRHFIVITGDGAISYEPDSIFADSVMPNKLLRVVCRG